MIKSWITGRLLLYLGTTQSPKGQLLIGSPIAQSGEAKLGLIYKDEFIQRQLRIGDVYRIPAGSTFYIVNSGETQRLHIICSIDPYEGLGIGTFQVHIHN